ncbi:hypothetical protein [Sphingobacterium sp. MYb382]|uniref:hypothetical protein n=1 Tax=Sphingobacterium sp. MYb382 TaxID=2745278 RepID=UPI0030AE3EBB
MEEEKFSFSGTFQKGKEYIDTQVQLAKLKVMARGSRLIGSIVLDITKLILFLLVLFFFSLALGFYLSALLNNYALGFFLTGCIFLLIILIVRLLEPKIEDLFRDALIRKLTSRWDDEAKNESETLKENDDEKHA